MSKDSCTFFKEMAHETWERIWFVRQFPKIKVFETTITQNILYYLMKNSQNGMSGLRVFGWEAHDEPRNGNDIELYIENARGQMEFYAVQAKIVYRNERYGAFNGAGQTASLIAYARRTGGTPLYLFYNFSHNIDILRTPYLRINPGTHQGEIGLYGCSIAHAYNVLGLLRTGPRHPHVTVVNETYAVPWHLLVCGGVGFEDEIKKKTFSKKEILSDENWSEVELDDETLTEYEGDAVAYKLPPDFFKESSRTVRDEGPSEIRYDERFSGKQMEIEVSSQRRVEIGVGRYPFRRAEESLAKKFVPSIRIVITREQR